MEQLSHWDTNPVLEEWAGLGSLGYVLGNGFGNLPYKKTCGLPILWAKRLREPVQFFHPKGAVGIVRMS